jgi:O-antigen/teichoic acid export membrane protein
VTAPPGRGQGDAGPRGGRRYAARHLAEEPRDRALRRDTVLVATGQLVAVLSGFLLTLVGARVLSPTDFGALSWALSWLAFLAVLAQFGLTQVATIAFARGDAGSPAVLLRRLLLAQAAAAALVVALWLAVVGPLTAGTGTPPEAYRPLVLVVALWLPAAAAGPVLVNVLRARARFGLALVFGEHVRRVLVIGVLLALAAAAATPSLRTALWWAVALETAVYLGAVLLLAGQVRGRGGPDGAPTAWGLLRSGRAFTLATLASVTVPQAGIWLLALVAPAGEVAVLSVAVRIALLLAVPTAIGMRTLAPRVAAAAAAGRLPGLAEPVRRFAVWSTAATALGLAVLAAGGPWLVPAVFGEEYATALAPALVMGAGALVNAWTGPCSVLLSHAGRERVVAASALASSAAFVALALWWAGAWGATGVAAAAAVAMAGRNLYLARAAALALGIRTIALPARRRR